MEHWFDRLGRAHTRRTALKTAVAAGAALLLPMGRPSSAEANQGEKCFKDCVEAASAQWGLDEDACVRNAHAGGGRTYVSLLGGLGPLLLNSLVEAGRNVGCSASAELDWHRAVERCLQKECGDPGKYPGGNAPRKVGGPGGCDPGSILCGEDCCDLAYATCVGCNGQPVCCRINGNCCPGD